MLQSLKVPIINVVGSQITQAYNLEQKAESEVDEAVQYVFNS